MRTAGRHGANNKGDNLQQLNHFDMKMKHCYATLSAYGEDLNLAHKCLSVWFLTRTDTNQPVKLQSLARGLIVWIKKPET